MVEDQTLRPAEIFQDTPVEVEILTEEEIQALPAQNVAEVVRRLPGIRTQQRIQGEEDAVSIEGMPPSYTTIVVDGQRYTGEIGGVADLRDVPLENVERIEILRGTQGLRYGTEAAGGVVNIVTKDAPDDGLRANLDVGAGRFRNVQTSGTAAYGNDRFGGTLSFDRDQISGFNSPDDVNAVFIGAGRDSRRTSRDVNGSFEARLENGLDLTGRFGWRDEDQDVPLDDGTGEVRRDDARWRGVQEFDWFATESTRLSGAVSYYRLVTQSSVGRDFELDDDEWKLDAAVEHFFELGGMTHAVTAGLDGRIDQLRLDEGSLSTLPEGADLEDAGSLREGFERLGVFLIGESEISDLLSFEAGVRLQLHSEFDSELLPQAAVLFSPFESLKIRLSAGRNYRTPSLRDLFQPPVPQLGNAYFLAGNPDLEPESSTSYRIGFEYSPFRWLSFSSVGFFNDIEDHIRSNIAGFISLGDEAIDTELPTTIRPGLDAICAVTSNFFPECALLGGTPTGDLVDPNRRPLFRRTNLDSVRTRGVEARLELRPREWFELQLGYTLLDTQVVDSNVVDLDELPNEPKHTFDAALLLKLPRTRTGLSLRGRWRDRALFEGSGTGLLGFASDQQTDPSLVLDARITQPIGEHAEIYLDGFNLTDEESVDSYAVRGRAFFVGLRLHTF